MIRLNFKTSNNSKMYKIETIWNSAIYIKKLKGYLLDFFYLVVWKNNFKKKYFKIVINNLASKKTNWLILKKKLKKLIATFLLINSALPITRVTIKLTKFFTKWKQSQLIKSINK